MLVEGEKPKIRVSFVLLWNLDEIVKWVIVELSVLAARAVFMDGSNEINLTESKVFDLFDVGMYISVCMHNFLLLLCVVR